MGFNTLHSLQYCEGIVENLKPFLYYTHIPPTVLIVLLAVYLLFKDKNSLITWMLFGLSITFALWTLDDLFIWFTYDQGTTMMFLWSLIGILSSFLFVFTSFFIYLFVTGKKSIPSWFIILWILLLIPVVVGTPTDFNLMAFQANDCDALDGPWFLDYYNFIGLLTAIAIPFFLLIRKKLTPQEKANAAPKSAAILAVVGAELFLITFLATNFLASYLVDAGVIPDFGIEDYGILAMAIFTGFLGYIITEYRSFNIKILGTQALILALIATLGSELVFAQSKISLALVIFSLILAVFFGSVLVRSVKREVAQRERIEKLADELEKSNKQQVVLIHFITHQIKGFLTKSRNIFSMALEGDFGTLPEAFIPLAQEGLRSDTQGVTTVQEILNAANVKSGAVKYSMESFDVGALIQEVAAGLKEAADKKKLNFTITIDGGPYMLNGDRLQLQNALKNLIDNSIKYTPSGSVTVTLKKDGEKLRFMIEDTGVGITPEDMSHLFTEGGHGKESTKVNVESTGFGLYIVKNIVEAHHGKVWAESEGAGKGSRFIVELPLNTPAAPATSDAPSSTTPPTTEEVASAMQK